MKKILLIGALAMVAAVSSYGQGSVSFANSGTTSRVWYEAQPGAGTTWVPAGAGFTAELVYAPDGTPTTAFDGAAVRVGATTTFGPQGGLFSGGGRTVTSITPAGGFGLFQVRVWETAKGNDYRSALLDATAHAGASGILRVDTGDPTSVPPGTATPLNSAGLASFTVTLVPEPSVIGLGLLGVGTLLMLRRRK